MPQNQKKELMRDTQIRFIAVFTFIIFLWALIFLVISYNSVLYLRAQLPAIEDRITLEFETERASTAGIIKAEIDELNEVLLTIDKIRQKDQLNFPQIFRMLGSVAPEGANLTNIAFQDGIVNLRGHAETRADVLLFKENLENEESFYNVISPLSNIVKESDIDFNFSFSL